MGYSKYPLLVVVNDYWDTDEAAFSRLVKKHKELPIRLEKVETNSFELGGLYAAVKRTDADEFLLLPHSCEIRNTDLFDMVFDKYRDRSVAFGVQTGNWNGALGVRKENEGFILKHLNKELHQRLLRLGSIQFWQGHIGKYRRAILEQMQLEEYLPTNMIEAISMSELLFTSTYQALDPGTVVLFPDWKDGDVLEEKFGRQRKKIANDYIVKWKTHWTTEMVFEDMQEKILFYRVKKAVANKVGSLRRRMNALRSAPNP